MTSHPEVRVDSDGRANLNFSSLPCAPLGALVAGGSPLKPPVKVVEEGLRAFNLLLFPAGCGCFRHPMRRVQTLPGAAARGKEAGSGGGCEGAMEHQMAPVLGVVSAGARGVFRYADVVEPGVLGAPGSG